MSASKNGEISFVIDIGSQSVGGALVISGEKPEIIFSKRIRLPWEKVRNEERSSEIIIKSLNDLVHNILSHGATLLHLSEHKLESKRIKRTLCLISSPWCISKTTSITHKSEKNLEITPKIMEMILNKDEKIQSDKKNRILEKKVTRVKLNGYDTEEFLNKHAKEIEISVFEGQIQEDFMAQIEKVILKSIHSEVIFHSYTLGALITLQDLYPQNQNYSLIEITGGNTDVTVVEDGLIKSSKSFTRGSSNFLGRVSDEYDVSPDIALSFLKIYHEKRTEENFQNRIEKIVVEEKNMWIEELQKTFANESVPSKSFIMVDPNFLPFFEEYLAEAFENKNKNVSIMFIGKALKDLCISKTGDFDPFLFLAAIFLKRLSLKS